VLARFEADRDEDYNEFLDKCADFDAEMAKETKAKHFTHAELEESDVDLKKLRGWLEKIKKLDFYGALLRAHAEERLRPARHCLKCTPSACVTPTTKTDKPPEARLCSPPP
jgi:hypothetical protein